MARHVTGGRLSPVEYCRFIVEQVLPMFIDVCYFLPSPLRICDALEFEHFLVGEKWMAR